MAVFEIARDSRGGTWIERCTLWEQGTRYSMTVDTSDYPYPLRKMQGTWGVEGVADGSRINMRFDYAMKYVPVGWMLQC